LREEIGVTSVKDGCSPQGQCGCCTVLVDGAARVACVTPVRRVAGRSVTTVDGLAPEVLDRLVDGFVSRGASQCGFCTPGILCRLAALGPSPTRAQVETALLAHLCRCTGWGTIVEAATAPASPGPSRPDRSPGPSRRGVSGPSPRATIEGRMPQRTGPDVVLGRGGFAGDAAPAGCLIAVPDGRGGWAVGETLAEARAAAGKIQGRRSGQELTYPIDVPPGDWDVTLQTTWVEPAYLEPDSSWCEPGGEPASPVANGGAFGGKLRSPAPRAARQLADRYGRPVRVQLSREDVVRLGPKRPPVAAGIRRDGTGVLRVAAASNGDAEEAQRMAQAIACVAPGLAVEPIVVPGPAMSAGLRAAGWAEAAVMATAAHAWHTGLPRVEPGATPSRAAATVVSPDGALARAEVVLDDQGWPSRVAVDLDCGEPLDETVLRSYCVGAAHMGLGWVCAEAIAVDPDGVPEDLTIRSFGILRAKDTPGIDVSIARSAAPAVNGSDAVFAATAAAAWLAQGLPSRWPTKRGGRR
jgi:aerobic-type carbon monoxide dehydrogenase small subunit (CoxS/CutS family)